MIKPGGEPRHAQLSSTGRRSRFASRPLAVCRPVSRPPYAVARAFDLAWALCPDRGRNKRNGGLRTRASVSNGWRRIFSISVRSVARPDILAKNKREARSALWSVRHLGRSADRLASRPRHRRQWGTVAASSWQGVDVFGSRRGSAADLVLLLEETAGGGYSDALQAGHRREAICRGLSDSRIGIDHAGGIFVRKSWQMVDADPDPAALPLRLRHSPSALR